MTASTRPPALSLKALRGLQAMAAKFASLPPACLTPEEAAALAWLASIKQHRERRAMKATGVVATRRDAAQGAKA